MPNSDVVPYHSWLMIFYGHSGSSATVEQFAMHPQVRTSKFEPVDQGMTSREALNYTWHLFEEAQKNGTQAVGFKMRYTQIMLNRSAWISLVREHNTRIFWQEDTNCVRQTVTPSPAAPNWGVLREMQKLIFARFSPHSGGFQWGLSPGLCPACERSCISPGTRIHKHGRGSSRERAYCASLRPLPRPFASQSCMATRQRADSI